jgi:hypothetical protein
MLYVVQPGDSLWKIAAAHFERADQWPVIAQDNQLRDANRLLVGQRLFLRDSFIRRQAVAQNRFPNLLNANQHPVGPVSFENSMSLIPGRGFFFVLADEINPLAPKVVRKVMVNPLMAAELSTQLGRSIPTMPNPARFGLQPTDVASNLPPGRHAMGMKPSPYSSASSQMFGASRIEGNRFWIDVNKAKAAGASFHGTEEILADLDRIAAKTADAAQRAKIENLKNLVRADAEVLVKGAVPATAVKGAGAMALTRGLQGVQVVGFAMTAVDMTHATQKSIAQNSVKPVAAETVRQAGGWAASWAGMKLGAAGGAALGIETGPGAIITGLVGGVIGGVAGYYGADWIADHIDRN